MKREAFKVFNERIDKYGFESNDVQCIGFAWYSLTDKQLKQIRDKAIAAGYKEDENGNVKIGIYTILK